MQRGSPGFLSPLHLPGRPISILGRPRQKMPLERNKKFHFVACRGSFLSLSPSSSSTTTWPFQSNQLVSYDNLVFFFSIPVVVSPLPGIPFSFITMNPPPRLHEILDWSERSSRRTSSSSCFVFITKETEMMFSWIRRLLPSFRV